MKLEMEVTKATEQRGGTYAKGRTFYAFIFLPVELVDSRRLDTERLRLSEEYCFWLN
jgi:hypothetical protein